MRVYILYKKYIFFLFRAGVGEGGVCGRAPGGGGVSHPRSDV